jgi:glycosyltransferase involved in cell wall biosynthesis
MPPEVSVLLPCRNALPFLPDAVGSVLAQRGVRLELIAVDDSSMDGSLAWLQACAAALQERRACGEAAECAAPCVAYDAAVEEAAAGCMAWEASACVPLSPADVAARASPGVTLRVLSVTSCGPSGQGLALNTALALATAPLVGEMEADDVRPPHAFATLRDALAASPAWHGATSQVAVGGWERPGMARWVDWMNTVGLRGPHELASARFVEIPALRAAGLYRREALARIATPRVYRDLWQDAAGALLDAACGPEAACEASLPGWWPVDSDFFGRFFDAGLVLGKVAAPLYVWRQYPAQSTRTHARCALPRLRAAKVHFLTTQGGPAAAAAAPGGDARVQLWGCGATLDAWAADLGAAGVRLQLLRWRPGDPPPEEADSSPGAVACRLFAFGMEKARRRVRASAPGGFDDGGRDFFVGS